MMTLHLLLVKMALAPCPGQMHRSMQVVGRLRVNNPASGNSVMISGNITGTGSSLELQGAGTLNLQGTNSFSSVTVKSGTLALGSVSANTTALGNAAITLEGGTLQMYDVNSMSTVGPWTNPIEVPEGKSAKWNLPKRWNFTNKLTGKGTLTLNAPYVRDEFRGDWSAFEGTLNITGSDFRINNTYGYGKATINLGSGVSFYHLSNGNTVKIGALSGEETSNLSGSSTTWQIGGNNRSTIYKGIISGTSSTLIKEGTGTLTLTNSNTYTGSTTVKAGTLVAAQAAASEPTVWQSITERH
jgi:autotransporter-associated beta strand protein